MERNDPAPRKFLYLDAEDTLELISEFEGCTLEVRHQAVDVGTDVRRLIDKEHARLQQESKQKGRRTRIQH